MPLCNVIFQFLASAGVYFFTYLGLAMRLALANETLKNMCKQKTKRVLICWWLAFFWVLLEWKPTPVFLPRNPVDRGAWWAAVPKVAKSQT